MTHLKSFSHSFQKIRYQGIVPEVCEPHSGAINIHGARKEEARTWEVKFFIRKVELGNTLKITLGELKKSSIRTNSSEDNTNIGLGKGNCQSPVKNELVLPYLSD